MMETTVNKEVVFEDLGVIRYARAWDYQEKIFGRVQQEKKEGLSTHNYLLFCEHPPVFTLGKSGSDQNLLINEKLLEEKGIEFFRINRGGDITFHGPGQIVGYPILDLENFGLGIKGYIELLEEAVILTLKEYQVDSSRLPGATGVWLDADVPAKARKICAIGVRASRFVTMHGFAFNVNTDLGYYRYINPCGFIDKGVTSMQLELKRELDMEQVKSILRTHLVDLLQRS